MQPDESRYLSDWVRIAERDLKRVGRLLEYDKEPELAGFCLQQAAEKFLKAFLLSQGWKLRRIHNLDTLLDDAISFDASFEPFRAICIRVTSFYFLERYPSMDLHITEKDVQASLEQILVLIDKIRAQLNK